MAAEFVPTRIVHYPCPAFEPKYDAAYKQVKETGLYVPIRSRKRKRPSVCFWCGSGSILKDGPLTLCESCMRHTLELRIAAPPPEQPAPAFRPKLSNREKRRLRLSGATP